MNQIEKVSEITYKDIADYIRLGELDDNDINFINTTIKIAKDYICKYTGRTEEEIDRYPNMVIVVFVLCQDMFDNRALYVDNSNLNNVVETILGMYSVNLL